MSEKYAAKLLNVVTIYPLSEGYDAKPRICPRHWEGIWCKSPVPAVLVEEKIFTAVISKPCDEWMTSKPGGTLPCGAAGQRSACLQLRHRLQMRAVPSLAWERPHAAVAAPRKEQKKKEGKLSALRDGKKEGPFHTVWCHPPSPRGSGLLCSALGLRQ